MSLTKKEALIAMLNGSKVTHSSNLGCVMFWDEGFKCTCENEFRVGAMLRDGYEIVREPLRAEFECTWRESEESIHPIGKKITTVLRTFVGKKTKVTIEEVIE